MRRCIWCTTDKDESLFNDEHVLNQAFGRFEKNLVLKNVCTECNQFFGDGVDLKLARDAPEGLQRVEAGLKSRGTFKPYGPNSTTRLEYQDGDLRGAKGRLGRGSNGAIAFTPDAQVGLERPDGGYEWFPLSELPTKADLVARGYVPPVRMQAHGAQLDAIRTALVSKGFEINDLVEQAPPAGELYAAVDFKIGEPEFRAITKIALNYLAIVTSPDLALMPAFDDARRFARYGEKPSKRIVHARQNRWGFPGVGDQPMKGHYLSVEKVDEDIVAQVSLLMRIRYTVTLAHGGIPLPIPFAHIFDLDSRKIERVMPLPLEPDARDDLAHFGRDDGIPEESK